MEEGVHGGGGGSGGGLGIGEGSSGRLGVEQRQCCIASTVSSSSAEEYEKRDAKPVKGDSKTKVISRMKELIRCLQLPNLRRMGSSLATRFHPNFETEEP
ncbi:unnamed protein product [Linum trigynum]|uniref:Uncharacterized protein n=1 Tax=Linum trigynum TaxID=586398 RepID=A0AAV2EU59_9ROSI